MADKSTRLILEALGRAAAEPVGVALLASKAEPGLFPHTALARSAAERCKEEGWLEVVRREAKGKLVREICILTDKGLAHLVHQSNPRQVLEDFVRVLEARQHEVGQLAESARRMQQSLQAVQTAVEQVLPRLREAPVAGNSSTNGATMNGSASLLSRPAAPTALDALIAEMKAKLAEWHAAAGAAQDCPLPELYRRLGLEKPVSIGQFHDSLRQLHEDGQVYLHPWTGPLYALPEPAFALLVGHEIAYYASVR